MTGGPDRRVAVICAAGSLESLDRRLKHRGWEVVRVESIRATPVRIPVLPRWLRKRPPADVWVVTSRAVIEEFLRTHVDWLPALREIPEAVAVGADTARALRSVGIRRVRTAPRGGSLDLLTTLGPVEGRTVLYLRSDRAGPELAHRLRQRGGRVRDRVVYRVRERRPLAPHDRHRLGTIPVWVVSSPSALSGFRHMIGDVTFRARCGRVRGFAMGRRTAHALREQGLRHVEVPAVSTEEGFTKLLEQALGDAPRSPGRRRR